tara:strand:+ start:889 stop:2043 length:1155 start_codon:yes stop_codon:yes gene_type:complete
MNVQEMHLAVQQGVDKINSLQADMLLSEEIDIELNRSLVKFINTKYGQNNKYREGFEQSQKRIDDLRSLLREFTGLTTYKEQLTNNIWVDTVLLPPDYMYLVSQQSKVITRKNCRSLNWSLSFTNQDLLYPFFVVSLSEFILNNNSSIPTNISLYEDIDNSSNTSVNTVWSGSGFSFPSDVSNLVSDLTDPDNAGNGFTIYWEQYSTFNYPGHFIIVVNTDTHNYYEWDASAGTVSTLATINDSNTILQQQSAQAPVTFTLDEKRIPAIQENLVNTNTVNNTFIQHDDIMTLLHDPFNTTKYTDPLTTIRGNSIDIYTNDIFIIDAVKITYIRNPRRISLSLGIDCELPDHTHQEIVDMTISSILEGISDPRYKSHELEVSKNE